MPRPARPRRGFTLMELVVTLIILGVILGIAVVCWNPFLAQAKSNEGGALLDRVVTLEQPLARDWGSYTSWPSDLADLGPDVTVLNGRPSKSASQVSVAVGSGGTLALAVKLPDRCLFRLVYALDAGGGTHTPTGIVANAACTGQSALPNSEAPLNQTGSIKTSGS